MNTSKARRATISLGEIPLNVYQMPDGSYRLAGRNVTDAVNEPANSLLRIMGVKSLKDLPGADPSLLQVKAETGESFIPVSLEDAINYWYLVGRKGNDAAGGLVKACAIESIERRADRAFGIERTEEERNRLLAVRMERLAARFSWTDIIKQDQECRGIYLTDIGEREFADLTRMVNRRLFGVPHFNCDRDNMTQEQQLDITAFERMMKRKYRPGDNLVGVIQTCLDFYESVEH